jgi:hypothetical protein
MSNNEWDHKVIYGSFFHKRSCAFTSTTNVFVDLRWKIQRQQVHCYKRSEDVGMTSDRLFNHQQRQYNYDQSIHNY